VARFEVVERKAGAPDRDAALAQNGGERFAG